MGVTKIRTRTRNSLGITKQAPGPIFDEDRRILADEYNNAADDIIEIQDAIGVDDAPAHGSLEYRSRLPSIDDVIASPGKPSQFVKTSGWADHGASAFPVEVYWSTTEGTVDDVDIYATFAGQGSWRRVKYSGVSVGSTRVFGVSDDTAAFERGMKSAMKRAGARFRLDSAVAPILTGTILLDSSYAKGSGVVGTESSRIIDEVPANNPTILWNGNDTDSVFAVEQGALSFDGLLVRPAAGKTINRVFSVEATAASQLTFNNLRLSTFSGSELIRYGVVLDASLAANLDLLRFSRCYFRCGVASVGVYGGQPYGLTFDQCYFNSPGAHGLGVQGIGVDYTIGSVSTSFRDCGWGWVSLCIGLPTASAISTIVVDGITDCEKPKRFIGLRDGSTTPGNLNWGASLRISGGRFAFDNYAAAATSPTIAADDTKYMVIPNGRLPTILESLFFSSDTHRSDWQVYAPDFAIILASGCEFPNTRPIRRNGITTSGGLTDYRGCTGRRPSAHPTTGRLDDILHSPGGTKAADHGSVVVSGAADSVAIAWGQGRPEHLAPAVHVEVVPESSAPAAGSLAYELSAVTQRGCMVTLGSAASPVPPGSGESVRVSWRIEPRQELSSVVGETAFTGASTVRGTAVDAGFDQPKWISLWFRLNKVPSATNTLLARSDGANGYWVECTSTGVRLKALGAGTAWSHIISYSASDIGKAFLITFTWDGSFLRCYRGRSKFSSDIASGYITGGAGVRMLIGTDASGANPCTSDITILGIMGADTGNEPSLSDIDATCDAVIAAGTLVSMSGTPTTEHLWLTDGEATVTDDVGADDITLVSGTAPKTMAVVPEHQYIVEGA